MDLPSCANGRPCPVRPMCVTFKQSHPITGCVLPCSNSAQCPPKADGPGIAGCYNTGFRYSPGQPFLMCGWGNGVQGSQIYNGTFLPTQVTAHLHDRCSQTEPSSCTTCSRSLKLCMISCSQ